MLANTLTKPVEGPRPLEMFVAVGDIHGCVTSLESMLSRVASETPCAPVVFVGDYIDRGPDSAGVLSALMAFEMSYPEDVICLMGNHEAMCLDFIDEAPGAEKIWLRSGGQQTLNSFGISSPEAPEGIEATRDQLVAAMGPDMILWLRERPVFWQSGNVIVSHAGGNPRAPINPRRTHGLLWGHRDTLSLVRSDGNWMVHGHFITSNPNLTKGRIPVDTGAYKSGILTAAVIGEGQVRFVQVRGG